MIIPKSSNHPLKSLLGDELSLAVDALWFRIIVEYKHYSGRRVT
jgi:hypothetical protein